MANIPPCGLCAQPTYNRPYKPLCARCSELERRITEKPQVALRILRMQAQKTANRDTRLRPIVSRLFFAVDELTDHEKTAVINYAFGTMIHEELCEELLTQLQETMNQ